MDVAFICNCSPQNNYDKIEYKSTGEPNAKLTILEVCLSPHTFSHNHNR